MINTHAVLLLSALAYTLPFIIPSYLWWLIFLFPPLLFCALQNNPLRWPSYLIWSLIISGIHFIPLADAIVRMTSAHLAIQLLPTIMITIYVAAYPFGLLAGMSKLFRQFTFNLFQKFFCWTVALWLYLMIVEYALFWPFGQIEGYVFMNPLLPLTAVSSLLILLGWLSMPAMLLLYCITTSALSWYFASNSSGSLLLLLTTIGIWITPACITNKPAAPPPWLCHVGHLPLMLPETMPVERGSILIAHEVRQLKNKHADLQLIVMPESAWNGLPLNTVLEIPAFKNLSIPHLIIGSFSLDNHRHHNSLYWFKSGQHVERFDKQHAIPFAERIPWGAYTLCQKLFFKKNDPICPSNKPHTAIVIEHTIRLAPYICSELFFSINPYDPTSTDTILATCNDWWFGLKPFRLLMLMVAQLRAIQWHRPIIYISFHYAQYIDPDGKRHPLTTSPKITL